MSSVLASLTISTGSLLKLEYLHSIPSKRPKQRLHILISALALLLAAGEDALALVPALCSKKGITLLSSVLGATRRLSW
jgi:hypothetical protein